MELKVSPVSQISVVTVQAPMVDTQSAETGEVIGRRQIEDLPLLGHNFLGHGAH